MHVRQSPFSILHASAVMALVLSTLGPFATGARADDKPAAASPPPTAAATASPPLAAGPGEPDPCTSSDNLLRAARPTSRGVTGFVPRVTDGVLAEEGTFWSSGDAVVTPASSRFEYDMGGLKSLKAFVLQGDNNDQYVLEGSSDGVTYKTIWVAPENWVGMGLRTRWTVLPKPVVARYLRVIGRGGDNYYSISELQAMCKVPALWPPKIKMPPKKYGWDSIDNDIMVNIKGGAAVVATVLLLLSMWRWFYERRITSRVVRGVVVGLFTVAGTLSVWLGGLADAGTLPDPYAKLIRAHGPSGYYLSAIVVLALAIALALGLSRTRLHAAFSATVVSLVVFGMAVLFWMGSYASRGLGMENAQHWAKVHGSAPGFYYSAVLLFSLALATLCTCLRRQGPRVFDTCLALVGVFCFYAWWNIGHYHFDHYVHIWEHYHYIMGAKYPELRYARLYQCTAVADTQDGLRARVKARKIRRIESDNELGTSEEILAHPNICTDHFKDPKRWEQFRSDIRFFRSRFSLERWDESQNDHGYNATPVWAIIGRILAERVTLTWDHIVNLAVIDSVYLVAMWVVLWWAFGWRAAAVAAVYWGCNFPARFYWNGGSFLRYDWLLWLLVGVSFLKKRKHFWGGAALTYSTLLRVFPGFVVAALILKALAGMVRERRVFLTREHQWFAAGCIATLLVLVPLSGWATNGLDAWPEFVKNSEKHLNTALTNNMGLKTVMGYDFKTRAINMRNDKLEDPFREWKDAKEHFYHTRAPLYYALIFLFCILLARAGDREEEDWVAACLGTGLIVISAELTCYYYGFLMTYGLIWPRRKLPGILASALAAFTCFIYDAFAWNDDHFAAMSLASVVVVVAVTANSAFGRRAGADVPAKLPPQRKPEAERSQPAPPASLPPIVPEPHS
jgi:hypothetical protein